MNNTNIGAGMTAAYKLNFIHPEVFYYFLLLIPVALLFFIHYQRRFPVISAFLSGREGNREKKRQSFWLTLRYLFSSFFFLLALACMLGALAGPRIGSRLVREFRRGCDVVLAIDISRSMTVRDCAPVSESAGKASSRLERALWIARNLVLASEDPALMANLAPGGAPVLIRFALCFGKGQSVLAVPLTSDTNAVLAAFEALSSDVMTSRGTNLENLIDTAADAFLDNAPTSRQIILLSDGEALSGSLSQAVERAKMKDITIYAAGLGSASGALVPEKETQNSTTTLVRSFLHAEVLRTAVERRGGAYIDGNSPDILKLIVEKILPLAGDSSWVFREEAGEQWHILVITGLICLLVSVLLTLSVRKPTE